MTIAESLLLDFDKEMEGTRRTLERIPETPVWKPHDKSMAIGRLAVHVAKLPTLGTLILTQDATYAPSADWPPTLDFTTTAQLLVDFDASAAKARATLAAATDEQLAGNWELVRGGQRAVGGNRTAMYRLIFFNHLIHHRAQLGVYLRLNDLPVPGLYGPSADEVFVPQK
jgi:uncharacterized damage-inducible protein DinB